MEMAERVRKRRRLNKKKQNPFIDLEAEGSGSEEEEDEVEEDYQDLDEDERYADSVQAHAQLHRAIQEEGEEFWASFVDRACNRSRPSAASQSMHASSFWEGLQGGGAGHLFTDSVSLWEIGCKVGKEEVTASKLMQSIENQQGADGLARSIIGRASIPGRIYAMAQNYRQARRLALSAHELMPGAIRKIPDDEWWTILAAGPSRFQPQSWVRVRGRRKAWAGYRGDTGLTQVVRSKKSLLLIPRVPSSDPNSRSSQRLTPRADLILREEGHELVDLPGSGFRFKGQEYTDDGFIVVDLDNIDVILRTDLLPTYSELELFRECSLLTRENWRKTSTAILQSRLKRGDRVRIVSGDYLGLCGTIVDVFDHEVEVNIASQGVEERIALSGVRASFRIGDDVKVVEGPDCGFIGWVTEIMQDGIRVSDPVTEKEVGVRSGQVEFYSAPFQAIVPRGQKKHRSKLGGKDPNAIHVGKAVVVVGAHVYKGYRGLIKETSPEGLAWVELEACQQKVARISLLDLAVARPDIRQLTVFTEETFSSTKASAREQLTPAPSTPMPSPASSSCSPAWDPSSRTPGHPSLSLDGSTTCAASSSSPRAWASPNGWGPSPKSPSPPHAWKPPATVSDAEHWLTDPCLRGVRIKVRVRGASETQPVMEFLGLAGGFACVRETLTVREVDLQSIVSVPPTEKDDLVTTLSPGDMRGKVLKVREIRGDVCEVRIPGKKLRKNENYPLLPLSAVFQIYPSFR